jgi:hypothetical protein
MTHIAMLDLDDDDHPAIRGETTSPTLGMYAAPAIDVETR